MCINLFFSIYYIGKIYTYRSFFAVRKNEVKDLVRKSNKGTSTTITTIGMIALLVIGFAAGTYLNSGQTGTSTEFPETSSWLMEKRTAAINKLFTH